MIYTTSLDGFNFRYSVELVNEQSETIVFVGGAFQNIESYNTTYRLWPKEEYNSIIVELPGFGQSDHLSSDYDFQFYVDCIRLALKESRSYFLQDQYIAYAYSYGAGSMFKLVSQFQDTFKCLIIGGASARFTPKMVDQVNSLISLAQQKDKAFNKEFINTFLNPELPDKTFRRTRAGLTYMLKNLSDNDLTCFVANYTRLLREHKAVNYIDIPTLVMTGAHDKFTKPEYLTQFNEFCSDLEITEIDDCDHFYQVQSEQPEHIVHQFIQQYSDFPDYSRDIRSINIRKYRNN